MQSAYGYENDFPRALEFAKTLKPGRLIDRGWPLRAHKKAIEHAPESRASGPRQDRLRGRRMSIAPTRMIERSKRRHPAAEREACVVEVHEHSPPTLFHSGETFRLERLPVGSRIVYPPPPLKGLIDVDAAICAALDSPLGMDPLDSLLSPGMKLTIAFDDISLPLPPMKMPDIRGRVIEHVLERAYRAGVEDIHLIAALALHRRMTPAELKRAVGAADLRRVLSRPALQPRRRGPRRGRRPRRDPPRRGRRALQARRRVRPADLREHQHRHDGRRAQVGRGRAGHVQQRQGAPQRPHAAPLAVVHGPVEVRAAPHRRTARARSSRPPSRSSTSRRRSTTTCSTGRCRSWPSPRRAGRRATRRRSPA